MAVNVRVAETFSRAHKPPIFKKTGHLNRNEGAYETAKRGHRRVQLDRAGDRGGDYRTDRVGRDPADEPGQRRRRRFGVGVRPGGAAQVAGDLPGRTPGKLPRKWRDAGRAVDQLYG